MDNAASSEPHSAYQVLARKYRPDRFETLIGQEPMVRTLRNAFGSGRIAHAWMLTGVRGVGKTTTARILARALNYHQDSAKEGPSVDFPIEGIHCAAIMDGRHPDVLEIDAASHTGIDDIRDIIESARYSPVSARYKVYIVDEVHMLSKAAFNGLLKTLEEPPAHVKFIFATTEIRKVPVTILSRCQRFDLRRVTSANLIDHLIDIANRENIEPDEGAMRLIARAAEGSVRDALSILDQAIAHGDGRVDEGTVRGMLGLADHGSIIDLFEAIMSGNTAGALAKLRELFDAGADPIISLNELAVFVHLVTRTKIVPESADDLALSEEEQRRAVDLASKLDIRSLSHCWQILLKGIDEVAESHRPIAAAEMIVVRLCHASGLPSPGDVIAKLTGTAPSAQPAKIESENGGSSPQSDYSGLGLVKSSTKGSPGEDADTPRRVFRFEDIIALARENRDQRARIGLERHVIPIAVLDCRLEIALTPDADGDLPKYLTRALQEWTGERWLVVVASESGGRTTVHETQQAESAARIQAAKSDALVEAVFQTFPDAEILSVSESQKSAPDRQSGSGSTLDTESKRKDESA